MFDFLKRVLDENRIDVEAELAKYGPDVDVDERIIITTVDGERYEQPSLREYITAQAAEWEQIREALG